MRFFKLFLAVLILSNIKLSAQDGSDIRYINIEDLDTSYIGKEIHIDFYNRSFAKRKIDSVTILINGNPVIFIEHREDNGYNNWFSRQYLEQIRHTGDEKLRVLKSVIRELTKDSILVTSYLSVFKENNTIQDKSFTQDIWFNKNIITQVLVHSEQCCK